MSLSDLMQKGWAKKIAAPAVAATDRAHQHGGIAGIATIAVANAQRDIASSPLSSSPIDHRSAWWRLFFGNGTHTEIRVIPAQNQEEIVSRYPDLEHAEPFQKPIILDEIPKAV